MIEDISSHSYYFSYFRRFGVSKTRRRLIDLVPHFRVVGEGVVSRQVVVYILLLVEVVLSVAPF